MSTPYEGNSGAGAIPGVKGTNGAGGDGVFGFANQQGRGVVGVSEQHTGVEGNSLGGGAGVWGTSVTGIGVFGKGGHLAGRFEGDVEVSGDLRLTAGGDFAEDFAVAGPGDVAAGSVVVLGDDDTVQLSRAAYDRRVAGVVSGAGGYRPGVILGGPTAPADPAGLRHPVALLGRAYCRVDAAYGPIQIGDLLTTSPTPGHAMKAADPARAFGAVLGKALRPLEAGRGLIPILIALQ